jgi:mono/diheme cytochrome c family protein
MKLRSLPVLVLGSMAVWAAGAGAQTAPGTGRGELLYANHCGACHGVQMHWRDKRLAVDWDTLKAQVRRWQGNAQLGWTEADIVDVTRFLNATIYRYPQTGDRVSMAPR